MNVYNVEGLRLSFMKYFFIIFVVLMFSCNKSQDVLNEFEKKLNLKTEEVSNMLTLIENLESEKETLIKSNNGLMDEIKLLRNKVQIQGTWILIDDTGQFHSDKKLYINITSNDLISIYHYNNTTYTTDFNGSSFNFSQVDFNKNFRVFDIKEVNIDYDYIDLYKYIIEETNSNSSVKYFYLKLNSYYLNQKNRFLRNPLSDSFSSMVYFDEIKQKYENFDNIVEEEISSTINGSEDIYSTIYESEKISIKKVYYGDSILFLINDSLVGIIIRDSNIRLNSVNIGMSKAEVFSILGFPFSVSKDNLIYKSDDFTRELSIDLIKGKVNQVRWTTNDFNYFKIKN